MKLLTRHPKYVVHFLPIERKLVQFISRDALAYAQDHIPKVLLKQSEYSDYIIDLKKDSSVDVSELRSKLDSLTIDLKEKKQSFKKYISNQMQYINHFQGDYTLEKLFIAPNIIKQTSIFFKQHPLFFMHTPCVEVLKANIDEVGLLFQLLFIKNTQLLDLVDNYFTLASLSGMTLIKNIYYDQKVMLMTPWIIYKLTKLMHSNFQRADKRTTIMLLDKMAFLNCINMDIYDNIEYYKKDYTFDFHALDYETYKEGGEKYCSIKNNKYDFIC